ncbi:DUF2911 domain-containing protein [uncultured Pontibacter sp.]|uniref:DUF2911 domain-containing protein n=1 Tax=uncultured Pontibacter sp. TaxID=453356 RepID=UPI0026359FD6|nr:DUF2911 domain-containing protein [uncultured Pontibacter sp.]
MNRFIRSLFVLFVITLTWAGSAAAQVRLPQASPAAMLRQTVGLTDITVNYHAPSARGRQVFGSLVPYGELWRAGANEATLVTFQDELFLNNERVPAGTYSFFIFPQNDSLWHVVLNRDTTLWGLEGYNELDDVAYLEVKPTKTSDFKETMQFSFTDISTNKAKLNLAWENTMISLNIETDIEKKALENIDYALSNAADDDWYTWAQCAEYMLPRKEHHQKALQWINKSIAIKENFYNNWIKAKLYAYNKEFQMAASLSAKAMELGTVEPETYQTYAKQIETAYSEWKKRK